VRCCAQILDAADAVAAAIGELELVTGGYISSAQISHDVLEICQQSQDTTHCTDSCCCCCHTLQVSDAVVAAIEELEPVMEAIYSAQTAAGQSKWNEHLAVDLRLAGEAAQQLRAANLTHSMCNFRMFIDKQLKVPAGFEPVPGRLRSGVPWSAAR
jgi:hypothetical protein